MKKLLPYLVVMLVLVVAATAYAWKKPPFGNVDQNKDGKIVFEEMVVFNSKLTLEVFAIVDTDKSGAVEVVEYEAMGGKAASAPAGRKWWRCSGKPGMEAYFAGTDALIKGQNDQAVDLLTKAIDDNLCVDYLSYAYYNRGIAYMRKGDDANARKSLEKARALNINDVVPPNDFGLSGTPRHH